MYLGQDASNADLYMSGSMNQSRILIADNSAINRKIAQVLIEKLGHQVGFAASGIEVMAALTRNSYELILMDVQMPDLDGYETTRSIRSERMSSYCDIPIVAMTVERNAEDSERCLKAGMNDFISKPLKLREIQEILAKWLKPVDASPSVLDQAVVDSLIELGGGSCTSPLVHELWHTFMQMIPPRLEAMRVAAKNQDLKMIRAEAHKLKSGGGNMGALEFAKICQTLESLQAWPEDQRVEQVLKDLELAFHAAGEALALQFQIKPTQDVA